MKYRLSFWDHFLTLKFRFPFDRVSFSKCFNQHLSLQVKVFSIWTKSSLSLFRFSSSKFLSELLHGVLQSSHHWFSALMNDYLFVLKQIELMLKFFVMIFQGTQLDTVFLEQFDLFFELWDNDLFLIIFNCYGWVDYIFRWRIVSASFHLIKLRKAGWFGRAHTLLQ